MPLYAYRCTQCGHRYEKIQSFSSEPDKVCPQCGGTVERPLTAPALQFKGAGWYINDYSSKGSSKAPAESSTGDAAKGGEAKPASDSKPATESKPAATESPAAKPASSSTSTT